MKIFLIEGGQGSGNFGHTGRKHQRGGSNPRNFEMGTNADRDKFGNNSISPGLKRKLDSDEWRALSNYTEWSYQEVNSQLRGNIKFTSFAYRDNKSMINNLDSAFKKVDGVKESFYVYRGVGEGSLAKMKGKTFMDKGFTSTSLNPDIARYAGNSLVRIKIPKGSKAIYIGRSWGKNEYEVLLPRGSKFRVNKNPAFWLDAELELVT